MPNIYLPHPAKVLRITKHTSTEWSFLLDYKLPEEPGKFVMLSLPNAGEVPVSISGFTKKGIEVTLRNVGQVTSKLFKLKAGDTVYVRGPYGNGFPMDKFTLKHLLIIAGGTAVAAVKPVIEYCLKEDRCVLRKLDVLVGFRSPRYLLFRDELKKWTTLGGKYNAFVTVDTKEDEEERWLGGIGFVIKFIKEVSELGEETQVIVVGPPLMMRNAVRELLQYKVKEEDIWLSFERHMKCGVGKCGHCRIREKYVCTDGPVFNYEECRDFVVL